MYQSRKSWAIAVLPDTGQGDIWKPPVDVFKTRDGWLLRFDLAGVRLEDVLLTVEGRRIGVSGLRRDHFVEEGWSYYSMEISWNRFERTVELPCSLDGARLGLELENGILLVRIVTAE
jgi:HSP20 family protein